MTVTLQASVADMCRRDGSRVCGAVGLFRGVAFVFCGLEPAHEERHEYAPNPSGVLATDTTPLPFEDVEPVPPEVGALDVEALRVLMRREGRGVRIPMA